MITSYILTFVKQLKKSVRKAKLKDLTYYHFSLINDKWYSKLRIIFNFKLKLL